MRRETRAFLDLVRDAEDPTRADEERVQRALEAAVAAGLTSNVVARVWFESTSWGKALAKLGAFGSKLGVIAACVAAGALVTADTLRPSGPPVIGRTDPSLPSAAAAAPSMPDAVELEPDVATVEPTKPRSVVPARARKRSEPHPAPRANRAERRSSASEPTSARANTLRSELDLLHAVQAALKRGDGAAALRELDSHDTNDRQLLAEREAARILALCQVGRVRDAQRAAADFSRNHPESVHREAIASSCANSKRIVEP